MTAGNDGQEHNDKALDAQQSQALDSLGIVVGEIAHDFNNILTLIFGYVEMALGEIPEGQRARSDLEHVLAAGDRARELVARILTYSNRSRLKRTPLDLRTPLAATLQQIRARLPNGVTLHSDLGDEFAPLLGNDTELGQILTNLCNNSLQALVDGKGEIRVSLRIIDRQSPFHADHPGLDRDRYAVLTVSDNGCGMDIETQAQMYTPFFTTARSEGQQEARAGLGLTTVCNITSSLGGQIFVKSAPGEGSTFELCLPLLGQGAQSISEPAPQQPTAKRDKQVLFIDDETAITEMARQMLANTGYHARFFTDGNKALAHFAEHPHDYDIVITDLIMPIIRGSEVAARCAEINPNIPIILSTGFSEKISLASCRKWGVTAVITKPFSIGQLMATLDELTRS